MTTTFVTVVRPPKADFEVLASAVAVLARAARATFRRLFQLGKPPAEVKREVCSEFGLLVRHWSGSRATAIQSVKSWREGSRERLRTLAHRLGDLRRRWPEEKLHPVRRRRNAVARRKAEAAIARLAKELAGLPRWCFGGRRLLRRGRLREWRRRRDGEALFCGETGSCGGNQVAQWRSGSLRLRLLRSSVVPSVVLADVRFRARDEAVLERATDRREPVTWRVKLLPRGKVQLCVTLEQPEPAVAGDAANGALGVDLNEGHLALVNVSPDGRVVGAERVPLPKDRDGLCAVGRRVVRAALERGVPIVLESLDFRKKKSWLQSYGRRFAEVLSTFRTRQVSTVMEREARREGVEVRFVDPAWSTKLGRLKYRARCRLGTHHAAALVLGRRGLGFGERLPADFRGEGTSGLVRTVECTGTSGFSKAFVQRLPRAWLEGGRHRRGAGPRSWSFIDRHRRPLHSPVLCSSMDPSRWVGSPAAVGRACV